VSHLPCCFSSSTSCISTHVELSYIDIRFAWAPEKKGRPEGFYIHHGRHAPALGATHFYFQSVDAVTKVFRDFCNVYDTELVVLRIKLEERISGLLDRKFFPESTDESTSVKTREKFIKSLVKKLNSGQKNCVVKRENFSVESEVRSVFLFFVACNLYSVIFI
tara:strand:+ start:319 stop:807 length:489 start_codon:yes stop_codon:yes gene_type:complete